MSIIIAVILTLMCIALRITISGMELAYKVSVKAAKVEDSIFSKNNSLLEQAYVIGSRVSIRALKIVRSILSKLRTLILSVGLMGTLLYLMVLFIFLAGAGGFLVEFCQVDKDGNFTLNSELVVGSLGETTATTTTETSGGTNTAAKYNISDADLIWFTNLCEAENGSSYTAIAWEASCIPNLYEASGKAGSMSIKDWANLPLSSGGWFAARSRQIANSNSSCNENFKKVVKAVICDGKRVLPKYINEHDTFPSDISYAEDLNGNHVVLSRDNMKQHQTILHNVYGSTWYFYGFPDGVADPFGYTSSERRQQYGDDCYDCNTLLQELGLS